MKKKLKKLQKHFYNQCRKRYLTWCKCRCNSNTWKR